MNKFQQKILFSRKTDEYCTPLSIFKFLNGIFRIEFDPCASPDRQVCDRMGIPHYFTKEDNGLERPWDNLTTFINPPYSRISEWITKSINDFKNRINSEQIPIKPIILLLPARTDTRWFHEIMEYEYSSILFIKGRLKFTNSKYSAPFPSCIIILSNDPSYMEQLTGTTELRSISSYIMDIKT